jgi:hypothetical protein
MKNARNPSWPLRCPHRGGRIFIHSSLEVWKIQAGLHVDALFQLRSGVEIETRQARRGGGRQRLKDHARQPGEKVRVTMKLRANAPVKTDCVAAIKFAGRWVRILWHWILDPGRAPNASDGLPQQFHGAGRPGVIMQKLDNVASGVENLAKASPGTRLSHRSPQISSRQTPAR